jgi:HD superfamily phosphohydrolase
MAAEEYAAKSITDPIYGYVGLSALEADVASSQVFQRLHNVRQLGLAHLVFPSAGYSRFAHSVGTAHGEEKSTRDRIRSRMRELCED